MGRHPELERPSTSVLITQLVCAAEEGLLANPDRRQSVDQVARGAVSQGLATWQELQKTLGDPDEHAPGGNGRNGRG